MQKSTFHKLAAVGVVAGLVGGLVYLKGPPQAAKTGNDTTRTAAPRATDPAPTDADEADKGPRLILGRVWLDRYPEKRGDDIQMYFFGGGGTAFTFKGSMYKRTLEVLDFERQKDRLDITFLHDKRTTKVKFKVESCSDKPRFDACLTFDPPFDGKTKLYGWLHDEDADKAAPWAREWRSAAEALAKQAE